MVRRKVSFSWSVFDWFFSFRSPILGPRFLYFTSGLLHGSKSRYVSYRAIVHDVMRDHFLSYTNRALLRDFHSTANISSIELSRIVAHFDWPSENLCRFVIGQNIMTQQWRSDGVLHSRNTVRWLVVGKLPIKIYQLKCTDYCLPSSTKRHCDKKYAHLKFFLQKLFFTWIFWRYKFRIHLWCHEYRNMSKYADLKTFPLESKIVGSLLGASFKLSS